MFTGCVPKYKVDTPSVRGQVVDSLTKEPIPNAMVAISIKTDEDGKFFIPKKNSLGIATPMGGIYRIDIIFDITKDGYYPLSCKCDKLVNDAQCNNENIAMTKILTDINISSYRKMKNYKINRYGFSCW